MIRHISPKRFGRAALLGCAALALFACDEKQTLFQKKPTTSNSAKSPKDAIKPTTAPKGATKFTEKDVEAPQVFQKTAKALWDGRPSLGGVWVAHPDNKKPERVIIRNKANGKSVIGALFNRERSLPGPAFQLSSDAATALGVPAGSTIELTVTAMRVEKTPIVSKTKGPQPAPSEDIAISAIDTLDEPSKPAEKPKKISKWKARKMARDAEKAKVAGTVVAAGDIATKTLPKPPRRGANQKPAATTTPSKPAAKEKPVATPKPTAKETKGGKYAQLGLFSVESNAKGTLAKLKSKGLSGKIVTGNSNGKKYYRVLAGPAASSAEQKKILSAVKAMGFSDAYLVKG